MEGKTLGCKVSTEGLGPGQIGLPLELSLKPALKRTSSRAKKPRHENCSSAGKALASVCLAAYSGEHLPLVHRASRSDTVSLRQRSKREGKREHVTEGMSKEKGGRKDTTCNQQAVTGHTRLRLSQETQTSTKAGRRQNP